MPSKVIMPKLGESVVEGTVVSWLKKAGDFVEEFESLLEVESAKVNTEIPSPAEGYLLQILIQAGQTVPANTVLAWIGEKGEEIPQDDNLIKTDNAQAETTKVLKIEDEASSFDDQEQKLPIKNRELGFISPVVARIAQENNIDLTKVEGTGNGGRISKKDVLLYIEHRNSAPEEDEPAAWETPGEGDLFRPTELQFPERFEKQAIPIKGEGQKNLEKRSDKLEVLGDKLIPHSKIRRMIADHMVQSKHTSPHVTTVMEANMQPVFQHREKFKHQFADQGIHLTYTAYFIAAVARALQQYPMVNSSWTEEGVLIKKSINIGMATSLGSEGLIVPVIKNADSYSLSGISRLVNDLGERAKNRKLAAGDVLDGTFTITNHGTAGSLFATPIINQPQCAILGVGLIQKRVIVIDDAIAIRPMAYLSLSFDHRILDGAVADSFLGEVVEILEKWQV